MGLLPGSRVGQYEVVSLIGSGGMGEVYRGIDPRLNRPVAIKVLHDAFTGHPDRLGRFAREARLLASLNHPHIAGIYGLEETGGLQCLVLEFVPGVTLADRLRQGPLPIRDALVLARQMAEALEAAHEKGIIHRDLKPANIKIAPDGAVKVLDFGLAKAVDEPGAPHAQEPTLTGVATHGAVILGTAAYMSPEQARGKPVDRRGDIWAFGCVLYEMLSGRQAFGGETVSDSMARVLEREAEWSALPAPTPSSIRDLLRRCLQKDVKQRLHDIADARLAIEDELAQGSGIGVAPPAQPSRWRAAARWAALVLFGALAGAVVTWTLAPRPTMRASVTKRLVIALGEDQELALAESAPLGVGRPSLALSPDGRWLVYAAKRKGIAQLFLRAMDRFESVAIPGTDGAFHPLFSPDGEWIGFLTETQLKKVSVRGGDPVTLCEARNVVGAAWAPANTIYLAEAFGLNITRVAADGGRPELIAGYAGLRAHWPFVLPGGGAILYSRYSSGPGGVSVLDLSTRAERTILPAGGEARFVPTGHLVVAREGQLLAAPFDLQRRQLAGPPIPILSGLRTESQGVGQYSFADDGTLVYAAGRSASEGSLVSVDRSGVSRPLAGLPVGTYGSFRLSPDGLKLAVMMTEARLNLWVYDLLRGTRTRVNVTGSVEYPVWTPDGRWVSFASVVDGRRAEMFRWRADGAGEPERLSSSDSSLHPYSWSPDGQTLAYVTGGAGASPDIWLLSLRDRSTRPFLRTGANESFPMISPDGRWIAYGSDESGRFEVYVTTFPEARDRWQVSTAGGEEPMWSRDGRELFYRSGQKWMVVRTATHPAFKAGLPQLMFEGSYLNVPGMSYDVLPDSRRFLLIRGIDAPPVTHLHVVLNWFEELTRRVPLQ